MKTVMGGSSFGKILPKKIRDMVIGEYEEGYNSKVTISRKLGTLLWKPFHWHLPFKAKLLAYCKRRQILYIDLNCHKFPLHPVIPS